MGQSQVGRGNLITNPYVKHTNYQIVKTNQSL